MRDCAVRLVSGATSCLFWLTCAFGLLLSVNAGAQTASPPPVGDVFAGDARLAQQVRVQAPGLAVKDLLALLSDKTGVLLTANNSVAQDKVIAFSPERPLQATLADIAELFNDVWRRDKTADGKPRYILTRSLRAIALEESLLHKSRNRLMTQLESQVNALSETPEQLSQRSPEDPIRKNLLDVQKRAATQVYAVLTPDQREAMFSRRILNFPASAINPQMRAPVGKLYEGSMRFVARFRQPEDKSQQETVEDYARHGIQFAVHTSGGQALPAVQVYGKGSMYATFFAELDARKQWILPAHGNPYTSTRPITLLSLPDAEQTRQVQSEKQWVDRLAKLAAATNRPVLADFYRSQAINVVPAVKASPVNALLSQPNSAPPNVNAQKSPPINPATQDKITELDALCLPVGYLWWVRGNNALLLRKRDWYEQRLYEVPEDWLNESIKRMAAQNNVPTLADYLRARQLTNQQILGLNSYWSNDNYSFSETEAAGTAELLAFLDDHITAGPLTHQPLKRGRVLDGIYKMEGESLLAVREALQAFLNAQSKPLPITDITFFRVDANLVDSGVPEGGFKNAELTLMWNVRDGNFSSQTIRLPFRLPNEAQFTTEIEVKK